MERNVLVRWLRRPMVVDLAIATSLYLLDLATSRNVVGRDWSWVEPTLLGLSYLPFAWRRRYPMAVFLTALASQAVSLRMQVGAGTATALAFSLLLFTVAARRGRLPAALALAAIAAPYSIWVAVEARRIGGYAYSVDVLVSDAVTLFILGIVPFGMGRWARWSVRQRELVARHAAAAAVAEERGRVARDLHDIVAHAVTLMVLQAAGAARILRTDPGQAEDALGNVDALGQQAIVELRRLLGLLTADPEQPAHDITPALGIGDLDALVDRVGADLRIEYEVTGEPVPLAASVGLAGYRVVQEALTNAARYADRSQPVSVAVGWQPEQVEIRVANHAAGSRSGSLSIGHGLLGLHERVRAAGGTFDAGAGWWPDGRFEVRATLPAEAALAAQPAAVALGTR
jgi:signal transduction histidine kinase